MSTQILRQAIARMFPDEYSRWTWRSLIADYVDIRLKALTIHWMRYLREQTTNADAVPPVLSTTLQPAAVLLAKQRKLTYEFLAFSHYVQAHQVGALIAERQHPRQQLTEQPDQYATDTPAYDELMRSISTKLPQLGAENSNAEAILQTFIDHELKELDRIHFDWLETLEDGAPEEEEPQPSPELIQAAATLAYIQGGTFASVAIALQQARFKENALHGAVDLVEGIAHTHKTNYDRLLSVTEKFAEQIQSYRRLFASLGGRWVN